MSEPDEPGCPPDFGGDSESLFEDNRSELQAIRMGGDTGTKAGDGRLGRMFVQTAIRLAESDNKSFRDAADKVRYFLGRPGVKFMGEQRVYLDGWPLSTGDEMLDMFIRASCGDIDAAIAGRQPFLSSARRDFAERNGEWIARLDAMRGRVRLETFYPNGGASDADFGRLGSEIRAGTGRFSAGFIPPIVEAIALYALSPHDHRDLVGRVIEAGEQAGKLSRTSAAKLGMRA